MTVHPDSERLSAWEAGELSPEEHRAVEAHLAGCDACRARAEGLRSALAGLRALPRVEAPPELERRLRRRLRRGRRAAPPVSSRMPVLIAAVTVALILAAVVLASERLLAPPLHAVASAADPGEAPPAAPALAADFAPSEAALRARLLAEVHALGGRAAPGPNAREVRLVLPEAALSALPPELRARLESAPLPEGQGPTPAGRILLRIR